MRILLNLLFLVVITLGCAINCSTVHASSDADTRITSDESMEKTLGSAFQYREDTEEGYSVFIEPDTHLPMVDYKSRVVLEPLKSVLADISGVKMGSLPPLSPDDSDRLALFKDLIEQSRNYVKEAASINEAVSRTRASGLLNDPATVRNLTKKINEQAKMFEPLLDLITEISEKRLVSKGLQPESPEFISAIIEMTETLFMANGKNVLFNPEAFAEFLKEEIEFVVQFYESDIARLENNKSVANLRIRAWLRTQDGKRSAIHVENYDNIEDLRPTKPSRIAYRMSEADEKRIREEYQLTQEAVKFISEIQSDKPDLRSNIRQLRLGIKKDLNALGEVSNDWLNQLSGQQLSDTMVEVIDMVINFASTEQKRSLNDLRSFIVEKKFKESFDAFKTALDKINISINDVDSQSALSLFVSFPGDVDDGLKKAGILIGDLKTQVVNLDTLAAVIAKNKKDISDDVLMRISNIILNAKSAIIQLQDNLTPYQPLVAKILSLVSANQSDVLTQNLDTVDPRVTSLPIEKAKSATIFLNDTAADQGDQIDLRAELLTIENGSENVQESMTHSLKVVRFGLHSKFETHLVFVDRRGAGEADDPEIRYDPAPSVSWTLHYLPRYLYEDKWKRFWSTIDPGFGINAATVDFEDKGVQIGLGAHITLFHDLLLFGYGYNLNAGTDRGYTFIGIGLMEAFKGIGGLFGGQSMK